MTLGEAEEDFRETANCQVGPENENDENLLRRAIALSMEAEEEVDEEELLRRAIALSLED